MKRLFATFLTAALLVSHSNISSFAATQMPTLPLTTPGTFTFGICANGLAMDCIVSVGVVEENGNLLPGNHLEDVIFTQGRDGRNIKLNGVSIWEINTGGVKQKIEIRAEIDTPANFITSRYTGAALRVLVNNAANISAKVRIVVRTSWLKPQNVQLVAENADFSQKILENANEWTFEGSATITSNYRDWSAAAKDNFMKKADFDGSELRFFIHHVGKDDTSSFFPIDCAEKGYTVQAWNSGAAGTPFWDKQSNSLNFGIVAPHLKANGEQNTGFFTLWAPEDFIQCRWPENTLIGAAKITVQVLNPDGTQQVAVTSVKQANKTLYFSASGFHYSSPTIRVAAQKAVATPTTSKAPTTVTKKTSITCVKGKSSKKVTAVKPQCPAGWKKK